LIKDREKESIYSKKLAFLSLGLNALLTAVKFLLYPFTGSAAILAEAVHSSTDVVGSLLVIAGIYLSEKKSKQFPWGLYKIENITAILSSGLIFLTAYEIAKMIASPVANLKNLDIGLLAVFLMALPNVFFYKYESGIAKNLNSPSLMADAANWKTDTISLIVVGAGIIGAKFSYHITDRVAAVIVLIAVIKTGYGILRDSMKSLLDASVERKTLDNMEDIIRGFENVSEIVEVNARNSGRYIFVRAVVRLSVKGLKKAHEIAEQIERKIKEGIPFVEKVLIHYEPEQKEYQRYVVMLADREDLISEHFAKAPFIALWDLDIAGRKMIRHEIIENRFTGLEKGKGIKLAVSLVEKGVDVLYLTEDLEGKGPYYVLGDGGVEIKKLNLRNLKEVIELSEKD